ncbi:hypothetical protein KUTeg_010792 [Tegillarca granosa]|uniref:Uncharacterized protein n=1 Tax=Tegillarca granosa TaxID=220873 RepID=A0ABQ9F225_TEGGR|nr:hypothetical protein KUTeg_010792 [Tegillarca granosa]
MAIQQGRQILSSWKNFCVITKTCADKMGQDQDHDFLTDLMSWCNKLSTSGHESFIITTNLQHRKMYLSGSKIGKMFLSREREICNSQQVDSSIQLQSDKNGNQLVLNQTESVAPFPPTVGIERETLSYSDDSKVIESNIYDPNIANNIKEEVNNMSEYLGARSITEAEFLGLKVEPNSNFGESEKVPSSDSAYTSNDMDDTQMSQEDSETDANSFVGLKDSEIDSSMLTVPVNASSSLQVSPSLFDVRDYPLKPQE